MVRFAVGTYGKDGGPGLVLARLVDEYLVAEGAVTAIANASFGLHRGGIWYFVDEAAGNIGAYAGPERGWARLACVPRGGRAPCHLALAPDGHALAVANYESGTVALIPLDAAGLPGEQLAVHQDQGDGSDSDRQAGPHAHWVGFTPDGGTLHAVDLGADRVFAFADGAMGPPEDAYIAPPGSGPRHLAFHPHRPIAYLVSELASTLTILRVEGRRLVAQRTVPTLPAGAGESKGGAILLSRAADRLWISNRGHDSIATFALDAPGDVPPRPHTHRGALAPLPAGAGQRASPAGRA